MAFEVRDKSAFFLIFWGLAFREVLFAVRCAFPFLALVMFRYRDWPCHT